MKKLLFLVVLLSLLVLLTGGRAYAQDKVAADIPFAFMVMNKVLPAGSYAFGQYGPPQILLIQELESRKTAYVLTVGIENDPLKGVGVEPKLIFRRYGEQYFLGQIWGAGSFAGREIQKSAKELQVAKNSPEPELIYVAAK